MIKERLKELDIKITELANYLSISRPTMYKFIEMYDDGNRKELTNSICSLFEYIESNEFIDKKNVISYILHNIAVVSDDKDEIATDDKKTIINYLLRNNDLDELFNYLVEASISSRKEKKTKKDENKTRSLERIIGIYNKEKKENK